MVRGGAGTSATVVNLHGGATPALGLQRGALATPGPRSPCRRAGVRRPGAAVSAPENRPAPRPMGSRQITRVPRPNADSISTLPPCNSIRLLTRDRPSPEPPSRLQAYFSKTLRLIGRSDANTGVGDGEQQFALRIPAFDADCTAGRGEFDCIGNQVEQRLLKPPLIGLDRADLRRAAQADLEPPAARAFLGQGHSPPAAFPECRPDSAPIPYSRLRLSLDRGCR